MKHIILVPVLMIFLLGCNLQRKSRYKECMDSGVEELYGDKLTPDFCKCFADGITKGNPPFETGNICSKPIVEFILEQDK